MASARHAGAGPAGFDAPLHVLLTGQPGEADRRLVVKDAPSFGLVGKDVQLTVRIEDLPTAAAAMRADAAQGWRRATTRIVPVGRDVPLSFPIDHGGPNVVEGETALDMPAVDLSAASTSKKPKAETEHDKTESPAAQGDPSETDGSSPQSQIIR